MTAVAVRPVRRADQAFIFDSWLKSFRGGDGVKPIPEQLFYGYHHKVVEKLLKSGCVAMIVSADDADYIWGYAVFETMGTAEGKVLVLHYMYLKGQFRKAGFGKAIWDMILAMEQPAVVMTTHRTGPWRHFMRRWSLGKESTPPVLYNPYLLWTGLPGGWAERSATTKSFEEKAAP